jgi:hypothetical protein
MRFGREALYSHEDVALTLPQADGEDRVMMLPPPQAIVLVLEGMLREVERLEAGRPA